jgi:hypothetical protein
VLEQHDVDREARGLLQLFAAHVGIVRPAMGPQRSIGVTQP